VTKTFRDLGVDPALCDALTEGGITYPFPIQELTLPLALEGHDLIGQARTGTGKTLAFGLPLLQRLDPASKHTQALVIVPTRELCLQVYSDLQIGAAKGLTSISVYGGVGYDEQIDALTAGAHVVVGTPGRLLDLLNRGVLDLTHVTQLVLDEADEMLDMGFLPDVERLVESCQGDDRHTMLFSATMPTAIVKLARRYMDHPTFTRADHEQKNTAPLVTQYFFEVHRMDKPRLLARILQSKNRGGVYVFVRTKHMADRLVNDLEELRIPSIAIHGDLRQSTREKNLDRFRSGQATVLVCTEVAARGLDVTGVTHVINYDCPDDEKMYLHRIGRTARAGESGVAITFAEFNEKDRLNVIRKAVGAVDNEVQQIFSTSKQLVEMFELPDERPWDHLSTKAGSDEARARRESRTDGKPKSGRAQEGRGGDHDARASGGRDQQRSKGRGRNEAKGARGEDKGARSEDKQARSEDKGARSEGKDGGASTKRDAAQTRSTEPRGGKPSGGRSEDAAARTKDIDDRPGRQEGGREDARRRRAAAVTEQGEGAPDASPAEGTDTPGTADRANSEGATTRTRTRTRARSRTSARDAQSDRNETTSKPSARTSGEAKDGSSPDSSTTGAQAAQGDDADASKSSRGDQPTSGGRQRARGGRGTTKRGGQGRESDTSDASSTETSSRGRSSGGRSGGGRSGDGRSSGGRTGGGRQQDERGGDRSGRDTETRETKRSDSSSRGGRSRDGGGRSGRSGRSTEGDATVTVAQRGEDARGEGQPQISRRVKIEHLP
jgi:superfamily II DNA/RNA helicase